MKTKEMLVKVIESTKFGKDILTKYGQKKIAYKTRKCSEKFKSLKDTKIGKRCFIVGNGPSLRIEDLEKIKNEDSFAVNRIYKIFNQTDWRPTYYCSQDTKVLDEVKDDMEIMLKECKKVFLNAYVKIKGKKLEDKENLYFFYLNTEEFFPELPKFSEDVSKQIYEGFTVAYASIQLAVYMGYSEIYIIGTDHSYNVNKKHDGSIEKKEDVTNYMKGLEGNMGYPPQLEKSTLAFRKANQVCKEKGIIIKNATRGGMLEEFERINFDDLF